MLTVIKVMFILAHWLQMSILLYCNKCPIDKRTLANKVFKTCRYVQAAKWERSVAVHIHCGANQQMRMPLRLRVSWWVHLRLGCWCSNWSCSLRFMACGGFSRTSPTPCNDCFCSTANYISITQLICKSTTLLTFKYVGAQLWDCTQVQTPYVHASIQQGCTKRTL